MPAAGGTSVVQRPVKWKKDSQQQDVATSVQRGARPAPVTEPTAQPVGAPVRTAPDRGAESAELDLWAASAGGGEGSSAGYSSENEEALGLQTEPPEFYDPNADDEDEKWVASLRRGHRSDALLSCPACLTTVCVDCQQHDQDESVFRAMFVLNCRVDTSKTMQARPQPHGKRRRSRCGDRDSQPAEHAAADGDVFHPVFCAVCSQDMGVWGAADQVYQFWHVVPTHS
mmetsp:Transcript_8371/g.25105  ORF Transcript_8371/g.25105 Transcript_8371/m.25105 type:complete len:228 (-) Transcript_8371:956-1639(-)